MLELRSTWLLNPLQADLEAAWQRHARFSSPDSHDSCSLCELASARSDGISDIRIRLLPEGFNPREMHSRFRAVSETCIASSELVFGNRMNGGHTAGTGLQGSDACHLLKSGGSARCQFLLRVVSLAAFLVCRHFEGLRRTSCAGPQRLRRVRYNFGTTEAEKERCAGS
jgi:hypothetical protein